MVHVSAGAQLDVGDRPDKTAATLQILVVAAMQLPATVTAKGWHDTERVWERTNKLSPDNQPDGQPISLPERCCLLTATLYVTLIALPLDHGTDLLPTADSTQPVHHRPMRISGAQRLASLVRSRGGCDPARLVNGEEQERSSSNQGVNAPHNSSS